MNENNRQHHRPYTRSESGGSCSRFHRSGMSLKNPCEVFGLQRRVSPGKLGVYLSQLGLLGGEFTLLVRG